MLLLCQFYFHAQPRNVISIHFLAETNYYFFCFTSITHQSFHESIGGADLMGQHVESLRVEVLRPLESRRWRHRGVGYVSGVRPFIAQPRCLRESHLISYIKSLKTHFCDFLAAKNASGSNSFYYFFCMKDIVGNAFQKTQAGKIVGLWGQWHFWPDYAAGTQSMFLIAPEKSAPMSESDGM